MNHTNPLADLEAECSAALAASMEPEEGRATAKHLVRITWWPRQQAATETETTTHGPFDTFEEASEWASETCNAAPEWTDACWEPTHLYAPDGPTPW